MMRTLERAWLVMVLGFSCCGFLLLLFVAPKVYAASHSSSSFVRSGPPLAATPAPSPAAGADHPFLDLTDPNIEGSIIGVLGAFLLTGMTSIFGLLQQRRAKNEEVKRKRVEGEREEDRKKYQRELLELQNRHQRDMEIEKLRVASEIRKQEEQAKRQEGEEQIRREMMEHAQSIEQRVLVYREAFSANPHIAQLQILGMAQPFKIKDVFVPMRVRLDERPQERLDRALQEVEDQHDPVVFMDTQQRMRQRRFNDALDPVQVIRQYMRCVILGDPGAGKTTLLKYLALKAISDDLTALPDLPIYVDLNKFVGSSQQDLLEFAASQWEHEYHFPRDDALSYITSKLNDGKAILFLDALDETLIGATTEEAEASYKSVLDKIVTTATRYHKSPIVVTARKAGYRQQKALPGFHQLVIQEFRPEDITTFVNNWFQAGQKTQWRLRADNFNKKLPENARLHSLASNPLLLSLIVLAYEEQNALPDDRAELYKRCADMLLFEWSARHDIPLHSELSKHDTRQLLAEIAWHFHTRRKRYFAEAELLQVIHTFLLSCNRAAEKSLDILNEITTLHGVLKPQAWQLYGFLHVSFQEYFAAEYARERNLLDELLDHGGDPSWEEVILLYASQVPDATLLLQKLLEPGEEPRQQEDIFFTNLLLAGRCLADHTRIQERSFRDEITSRLFATFLSTPRKLTREQIISVLTAIDDEAVTTRLLALLVDETIDLSIRLHIAETFRMAGKPSRASELLSLLAKKEIDASVRVSIAEALSRAGNPQIAYQLLRLLDPLRSEPNVYQAIVMAIGSLGDTHIAPLLLERLKATSDVSLRCSIVEALAMIGDDTVIGRLQAMLTDHGMNQRVRCTIADALAASGKQPPVTELLDLLSEETLETNIRCHIASTLGQSCEQTLVSRLKELYTWPPLDSQVRASISVTLGVLGERAVIGDLLTILRDTSLDRSLLRRIPNALVALGEPSLQFQLLALLPDTTIHPSIRRSIASALGNLSGLPICYKLLDLLPQERIDPGVRQQIALTLGKISECSIAPSLVNLLTERRIDRYVRMSIADALAHMREHAVVHQLLPLLTEYDLEAQVRQSIAKAVGVLSHDQMTVDKLSTCLANTDIPEDIFRALWSVSRRHGMKVFIDVK